MHFELWKHEQQPLDSMGCVAYGGDHGDENTTSAVAGKDVRYITKESPSCSKVVDTSGPSNGVF